MDLWLRIDLGVDNAVLAPKLEPRRNLLASSQVTMDDAPRLGRLKKLGESSGFRFPFLGNPLHPISPPGTIMTSVVRRGGVASDPKYGQVHGGGSNSPSSELRDFVERVTGARRPSFPSSSEALLARCNGVFGSHVDDGLLLSCIIDDGELDETLSEPGVSIPPFSDMFVLRKMKSTQYIIIKIFINNIY